MRPGLSARVVIDRGKNKNTLIAPRVALDLASGAPKARLSGGKFVPVRVGKCNAQECVVLSGLEEGQRLSRVDQESSAEPGRAPDRDDAVLPVEKESRRVTGRG